MSPACLGPPSTSYDRGSASFSTERKGFRTFAEKGGPLDLSVGKAETFFSIFAVCVNLLEQISGVKFFIFLNFPSPLTLYLGFKCTDHVETNKDCY